MKHRGFSKMISWILTAIMILTALPLSSIPSRAESVDTEEKEAQTIRTEESDDKENELPDHPENTENIASGVCGNLTWTLDEEGILTFSGEGYMGSTFSWEEYKDRIQTVLIEDGVKSITSYAFANYTNIRSVSIGRDVISIGPGAFWNCPYLEEVFYNAKSVNEQDIMDWSDDDKHSFEDSGTSGSGITLTLGDEVETVPSELFFAVEGLKTVTFGKKVSSIGDYAFAYCRGLNTITFLGDNPSFGSGCFMYVTCNAYYPYGNATWSPLPSLSGFTWIPSGVTSLSTITFDANGGQGQMGSFYFPSFERYDHVCLPRNMFTRNAYAFLGWNTKADGTGMFFTDGARVNPTDEWIEQWNEEEGAYILTEDSLTLYAQWTDSVQISFDANSGEGVMDNMTVFLYVNNDNTFLPQNTFTREGYSFRGWNTKADGTGRSCKDGARVNPTEGWLENEEYETEDYIIINQSITLYAQWIKDEIVIHFDPNGGVGEMEDFIVPKTFNWETLPYHTFSRGKHDFIGWNTKPDGTGEGYRDEVYVGRSVKELNEENCISAGDFICVTDDVTLYAQWEEYDAFTISFDPNGGEGQMEEVYVRVGDWSVYLPSCTFFREGHKFTAWNTKADGTGNSYTDYLWYDHDEDITLYAQWRQAGGPQVICSKSSDGKYTLSFVNSPIDYFEESEYNGESILQVWTGTKVTNSGEGENYDYYRYGKNEPAWVNSGYLFNRFVIDESFINVLPTCTAYWFVGDPWGNSPNQEIIGLEYLNTSATTDMSNMFYGCGVSELDLRSLITTNVTNMSDMFCGCHASSLDLSSFDTSNALDMSGMFSVCRNLTSLNLGMLNTSSVTNMSGMFASCSKLTSLDLSMLNTSSVTNMSEMFASCSKLTSLDLSMLNTSDVTNMSRMFGGCIGLNSLTLKGIDTSNVTDMSYMFGTYMDPGIANTSMKIKELDLSDLDTSSVTNMSGMFSGCNELTALDLSHFNTSQVQTMEKMFYSCLRLETLDLSSFDMRNVTNADAMFGECKRLKTIFCMDGDSAWPDDSYSQYSQGILFGSNTNLVGRYGTTEVPFNAGYADAEMARSAKLGGYFTPKYVTVGFDANGGTGELEGFRTYSGFYDPEGIVLPGNVFAKECGLFAGWNTRADGSGDFYEDCSAFAPLEDVILYAQWDDDHDWEEAVYVWANDYKTVTATRVCKRVSAHTVTETAQTSFEMKSPTCEEAGYILFTAVFENPAFETQTKLVEGAPALGHDYDEPYYRWARNNEVATAMAICQNDASHTVLEVVNTTMVRVEPTHDQFGYVQYKAVFTNPLFETQIKTIILPPLDDAEFTEWKRLGGGNRIETMDMMVSEGFPDDHSAKTILVATGMDFKTALLASGLAGALDAPLITVPSSVNAPVTALALAQIERLASEDCEVLVLGSTAEINDAIFNAIKAKVPNTKRLSSESGDAELLAKVFYEKGKGKWNSSGTFILSTTLDAADALSISPYAYASKTPIFFTNSSGKLRDEVKSFLTSGAFKRVIITGGTGVVSQESEDALKRAGIQVVRVFGSHRYLTSLEIARWLLGMKKDAAFQPEVPMSVDKMGVATGADYADALASVDVLGRTKGILLLAADNNSVLKKLFEDAVAEFIIPNKETMTGGYIFGGTGVVSQNMEDTLNQAIAK